MTRHVQTGFCDTVGVLCWNPGVLQTGKPWGAIIEDVQHLGPQVRQELENIPNGISCKSGHIHEAYISYTLSEVFIRDKPPTIVFLQFSYMLLTFKTSWTTEKKHFVAVAPTHWQKIRRSSWNAKAVTFHVQNVFQYNSRSDKQQWPIRRREVRGKMCFTQTH